MMKLPTIKFVFNRRKNATKKHPASVELRIGQGLKCKYLATGIRLLPKEWGPDRVTNRLDSMELNSTLDRHTGATLLLNSGVDMEVVAKVLGHSSTNITRSTYAKLLDKTVVTELKKANKKLSDNKDNKSLK